jgi:hypothetical protein
MLVNATNAVFFQEAVERTATDAKCARGFGLISAVASVRLKDMLPHVCEQINITNGTRLRQRSGSVHYFGRQIFNGYSPVVSEDFGSIDGIQQLADVSRPGISLKCGNYLRIEFPFWTNKVAN